MKEKISLKNHFVYLFYEINDVEFEILRVV